MSDPHCRIGQIRAKSGAVVRVLPDANAQRSAKAFAELGLAMRYIDQYYSGCLDGFAIMVWTAEKNWNVYRYTKGHAYGINDLPGVVAEALRREAASADAREMLENALQNR